MREIALGRHFLIHLIHVSGSILILCGVDGLSHGNLQIENLYKGIYLQSPVDHNPIYRSTTLLTWIQSWISEPFSLAETASSTDTLYIYELSV